MSDACVTYSVGFRSPSYGDVLASFADERSMDISADLRLKDQGFAPKSGEISANALLFSLSSLGSCSLTHRPEMLQPQSVHPSAGLPAMCFMYHTSPHLTVCAF